MGKIAKKAPVAEIKVWKKRIENIPFVRLLGMKVISLDKDGLVMEMKVVPKLLNYFGGVHGGGIVSLIDTAAYFSILPFLSKKKALTTTEIKTNFFRVARKGPLTVKAKIVHLGSRTAVGEAEIVDEAGSLVAKGMVGHLVT